MWNGGVYRYPVLVTVALAFAVPYSASTLCTRILIAALFDLLLCKFDTPAAYLHGAIDGEVYMEPLPC